LQSKAQSVSNSRHFSLSLIEQLTLRELGVGYLYSLGCLEGMFSETGLQEGMKDGQSLL